MVRWCYVFQVILTLMQLRSGDASLDVYVEKGYVVPHQTRNETAVSTIEEHHRLLSPLDKQPIQPNDMFQSPSAGTDIISKPAKLISCPKQTHCIAPELQLERVFNVYYCKRVSYGIRFYYLIREGLTLHPKVNLVSNPDEADVIVYLPESSNWAKSECSKPKYYNKMVVLDESDGSHILTKGGNWYILYFKRSFVSRQAGRFKGYMNYLHKYNDVFPMTYPLGEAYVRPTFNRVADRDFDVVCTLRDDFNDAARVRVRKWVNAYAKIQGLSKYQGEQVNRASRTTVDKNYFGQMYRAKIVVTVNPAGWEGDFRLMEALSSGALVFVDYMFAPRPHPLLDGKHVIYYDNDNKTDLFSKLDFYRQNLKLSRSIAINGYLHAMKYHRSSCLVDYVMRSVDLKLIQRESENRSNQSVDTEGRSPHYTETGLDMHSTATSIDKVYQRDKKKGVRNAWGAGRGTLS